MNTLQVGAESPWLVHAGAATMLFWLLKLRPAKAFNRLRSKNRPRRADEVALT